MLHPVSRKRRPSPKFKGQVYLIAALAADTPNRPVSVAGTQFRNAGVSHPFSPAEIAACADDSPLRS